MAVSLVLLFTGHRIDTIDRPAPRFPIARAPFVARLIASALPKDVQVGISSAANGGDILFLEACAARAIPCHIILPFTPEEFIRRSVATDASGDWEKRFHRAWSATPEERRYILSIPAGVDPYVACNDALLALASALGEPQLVALWDGKVSDGPGGTADLVAKARSEGWPVKLIDPRQAKIR